MAEQVRTRQWFGEPSRAFSWYPLTKWWQEPQRTGVEGSRGSLEGSSQYQAAPLFLPHICGSKGDPGPTGDQYWWRVSLDMSHFSPSEISLRIRDGFLEVTGKHGERQEEHGFTARCFTRKYRLPAEADTTKMVSTLSADGILTVDAPVPGTSVPTLTVIPMKVEIEEEEEEEEERGPDLVPGDGRAPEQDEGKMLPMEDRSDDGQPGRDAAGLQQGEETSEEPAGGAHPSVPAVGWSTEDVPDTEPQLEPEDVTVKDVPAGLREAAEEIAQMSPQGKGPQSEEDQELKDQEQEPQNKEQKDQELKDQELQDQEQKDQELKDQQPQDPEPQDQEQKYQKLKDQEVEDQELKDQEPEDQEPKAQELKDQEPQDKELKDQEPEDQEPKAQELKDQEPQDKELKDQEVKDQELQDPKPDDQEPEYQDMMDE